MAIELPSTTAEDAYPLINELPDEILGSIFWFNTIKENGKDGSPLYDPHQTTISTSHVCRQWRAVALSHSALWGRIIDFEHHPRWWVEELLSRSKESQLDIGEGSLFKPVILRAPRADWALDLAFQNAARIRTFSLNIRLKPWDFLCDRFLRHPVPSIEYLAITTSVPFPDCVLKEPLFADDAPRLRAVHLQRCLLTFTSPALHNLTELSVYDILRPPSIGIGSGNPFKIAPTPNQWLSILQNIPNLRYLTLAGAISNPTAVPNDPEPIQVSLPHLALLTVSSTLTNGAALFGHLTIPSECGLRLRLKGSDISSPDLGQLGHTLGHQLESWAQSPVSRYWQAKLLSGDRIHLGNSRRIGQIWNMSERDVLREHGRTSSDPILWLIFTFDSSDGAVAFLSRMFLFYERTYGGTTEMDLWIDEEFAGLVKDDFYEPCVGTFHGFEKLRTLSLLEQSPLYFLPLFQHYSSSSSASHSGPGEVLFPALETLVLTGTQIETKGMPDSRSAYFTLMAFLLWRVEVKRPMASVHITGTDVSERSREQLGQLPGGVKVTIGDRDSLPPLPAVLGSAMNYSLQM